MYSQELLDEMGLLNLKHKNSPTGSIERTNQPSEPQMATMKTTAAIDVTKEKIETPVDESPKLDKNEFRLLVKMLQAIGHECVFDNMSYDGHTVSYQLPNTTLLFNDIDLPDDAKTMNLCSLSELLIKPELKRPVWEKLKTLNN